LSEPAAAGPAPDAGAALAPREPGRGAVAFAAACCVGIAAIVAGRMLAAHPPMLWFDVDPAQDPVAFAGIAPSASVALDSMVLVMAAAAVFAMRTAIGRSAGLALLFLAAIGAVPVVVHGLRSADDCWRGLQWMSAIGGAAAIAACARAMPAARSAATRAVVFGVLLGAVGALAVRGGFQLWIEHRAMVDEYREHRAEILAAHGWAEGSTQALTYERRLLQPEATGWFGLANIASSVLAAGAIAFGWAAFGIRRVRPGGTVLLGGLAIACLAIVALNGSKGAIGATVAAALFTGWCAWRSPGAKARVGVVAALVMLVVAAVAVRGIVGESSGERSLLFRAQYAEGALRAFAAHPLSGVGPAGFGDAYLHVRPARAPEEVQSAHAAWADWLASLGVQGIPWIVLLLLSVEIAAASSAEDPPATAPSALAWSRGPLIAGAAMLVAATAAIAVEAGDLDGHSLLLRFLGALFAASVAAVTVRAALVGGRAWAIGTAGAALLLAMHAQVEMTLWWPGAVGWVAAMIVVAAGTPPSRPDPLRRAAPEVATLAVVAFLVPAALGLASLPRALAAEQAVAAAAAPIAAHRLGALGVIPAPTTPISEDRFEAARALSADTGNPWLGGRPAVLAAALEQAARAVALPAGAPDPGPAHTERCRRALAMGVLALRPDSPEAIAAAAGMLAEALLTEPASVVDREAVLRLLRNAGERQVACNPRSVRGWIRVSDAARLAGDAAAARAAAARALASDESYALDPLRMLPAAERARLAELGHSPAASPSSK
jgi:hypothetical protein